MNITSYNITDVAYHYIGLRALGSSEATTRANQLESIRRGVLSYVEDRALRLMLPEPRGTFESVAPKICQELMHFGYAQVDKGAYLLTTKGRGILALLEERRFRELRRELVVVHLETYENLAVIVRTELEYGAVWRPIVDAQFAHSVGYLTKLLEPTFGKRASAVLAPLTTTIGEMGPKKVEDLLGELVLQERFPTTRLRVPLFRGITDRLNSMRLVNNQRAQKEDAEFAKSYTPSVVHGPFKPWHQEMSVSLAGRLPFTFYLSDPDMDSSPVQDELLRTIENAFEELQALAGYYDLPDVRDWVCEKLLIPEASFDEGVNRLLDRRASPLTVSLQYERITARRRPLVRTGAGQISNLIRRA